MEPIENRLPFPFQTRMINKVRINHPKMILEGGCLILLNGLPSFNDPEIFYTGTHETHFLRGKSVKKQNLILKIPEFLPFYPQIYGIFLLVNFKGFLVSAILGPIGYQKILSNTLAICFSFCPPS